MIFFKKNTTVYLHLLCFAFLQTTSFLGAQVTEISEENQLSELFSSKHDTVVMCTMNHCSWCIKTKPHFTQLEERYAAKIKFYTINGPQAKLQSFLYDHTENGKHLGKHMIKALKRNRALGMNDTIQIPGYPTFLYIKHGKIIDIHVGGCSLETLEEFIENNHKQT